MPLSSGLYGGRTGRSLQVAGSVKGLPVWLGLDRDREAHGALAIGLSDGRTRGSSRGLGVKLG